MPARAARCAADIGETARVLNLSIRGIQLRAHDEGD